MTEVSAKFCKSFLAVTTALLLITYSVEIHQLQKAVAVLEATSHVAAITIGQVLDLQEILVKKLP